MKLCACTIRLLDFFQRPYETENEKKIEIITSNGNKKELHLIVLHIYSSLEAFGENIPFGTTT